MFHMIDDRTATLKAESYFVKILNKRRVQFPCIVIIDLKVKVILEGQRLITM